MNTEGMMPLERAKQLKRGERVRVMVPGRGDVDGEGELEFPAGEILTIDSLDTFRAPQGFAVTCTSPNGVTNVFDEADFGGVYPFSEVLPPLTPMERAKQFKCSQNTEENAIRGALHAHGSILGLEVPQSIYDRWEVQTWHLLVSLIRFCDREAIDLDRLLVDAKQFVQAEG